MILHYDDFDYDFDCRCEDIAEFFAPKGYKYWCKEKKEAFIKAIHEITDHECCDIYKLYEDEYFQRFIKEKYDYEIMESLGKDVSYYESNND